MIRVVPFGSTSGFSDKPTAGTHFYSQGFTPSLLGAATMYSIQNLRDSTQVSSMGSVKYFAIGPAGGRFALTDTGKILKETTPGVGDFSIAHTHTGSNGAGLLGDQYGNLLYASPTALGLYDGSS